MNSIADVMILFTETRAQHGRMCHCDWEGEQPPVHQLCQAGAGDAIYQHLQVVISRHSPQELGLHYTVHTSLDVVEERLAAASTKTGAVVAGAGDSRELYLGSLCTQVRRTRTLASQLMIW